MITKAVVLSINRSSNRCKIRVPLFETAADSSQVILDAIISIPPGIFNNIFVDDVVIVSFEENELEKPVVLGKLYLGANSEQQTPGGSGIFNALVARKAATVPCSTLFTYPEEELNDFKVFNTPRKIAQYIKWLEFFLKDLIRKLEEHFICFKNWVQWQLRPENVEIDDGNLDDVNYVDILPFKCQEEDHDCNLCELQDKVCLKNKIRTYSKLKIDETYTE